MRFICVACKTFFEDYRSICFVCMTPNMVVSGYRRLRSKVLGALQLASAADLVRREMDEVRIPCASHVRFGRGAFAILWGPPGAGKSTLALHWLNSIEGPVVLYAAEEGHATTLSERLKRVGVTRENFYVVGRCSVDELAEVCTRAKARALVIDSLTATAFTTGEVRTFIDNTKIPLCLAVIQVNKDGQMRGSNELLHEADVGVHVEKQRWKVVKSRYQELSDDLSGEVTLRGHLLSVPNDSE